MTGCVREERAADYFVPAHPEPRSANFTQLGAVLSGRRDLLANFQASDYRAAEFQFRILGRQVLIANSPESVRQVLASPGDAYERKSPQMRRALEPLLGDGLFISDGDTWRQRRPFVANLVHKTRMPEFGPLIVAVAEEMAQAWTTLPSGQAVDISMEMSVLTAQVISRTVFGVRLDRSLALEVAKGFAEYQVRADSFNVGYFLGFDEGLPIRRSARLKRSIRKVQAVVDRVLSGALEGRAKCPDAGARISQGDEDMLRHEAATLFMAGYETTANTLAWAWYMLANAPWAEAALHEEISRICGDRAPLPEDLPSLSYCRAVIEETLRLYPPVAYLARQVMRPGQVGATQVEPGELVMVVPWLLHRSPDLWTQPERFMPERFLGDERPAAYSYIPFAAGPRICPGMTLGLSEAILCLAILAQKFTLTMAPGAVVEPQSRLTLRPRVGIRMTVAPRAVGTGP